MVCVLMLRHASHVHSARTWFGTFPDPSTHCHGNAPPLYEYAVPVTLRRFRTAG